MKWNYDMSQAPRGARVEIGTAPVRGGGTRVITEFSSPRILVSFLDKGVPKVTATNRLEATPTCPDGRWNGFNPGAEPYAWAPWPEPADVV